MSKAYAARRAAARIIGPLLIVALVSLVLSAAPGYGQTFLGRFSSELIFVPVAPIFADAEFRALLSISVADAAFTSDTKFNLSSLVFQRFSLRVGVGALLVKDRLVFIDGFLLDRNELTLTLDLLDVHIEMELILDDLTLPPTPPALPPNIQPGLVLELSGRALGGILRIRSTTGFAVSATVEDLDLDDDREPDRIVSTPFLFREEVLGLDLLLPQFFTLTTDTLFTLAGWTKEIFGLELRIGDPDFSFFSKLSATFLLPGFVLDRIVLEARVRLTPLEWQSLTFFDDPDDLGPNSIAFQRQVFTLFFSFGSLALFTELCVGPNCPVAVLFPPATVEWRIGFELRFGT
jgi:hypothetical protein